MLRLTSFHLCLLCFSVVTTTSTVILGRYCRQQPGDLYSIRHFIIVAECIKLFLAILMEEKYSEWGLKISLKRHIINNPADATKMLVPSIICLIQNFALYTALSNLSAPVFQVLYQGKLVFTAILSVLMLGRSYALRQWACLGFLVIGICCLVLDENSKSSTPGNLVIGIQAAFIGAFTASFQGIYFEKIIKFTSLDHLPLAAEEDGEIASTEDKNNEPTILETCLKHIYHFLFFQEEKDGIGLAEVPVASVWMRMIQLSFFSAIIAVGQDVWEDVFFPSNDVPFFHGFTFWVWLLVLIQALGGLIYAAVVKHADNVVKGLATGVSVLLSTITSNLLFHYPRLSLQFFVGAILVLGSILTFGFRLDLSSGAGPVLLSRETKRPTNDHVQNAEDSMATPLLVV